MIASTEQVAENIRKTCEAMAEEVARRLGDVDPGTTYLYRAEIKKTVLAVLLDWLLGDWTPSINMVASPDTESNSRPQGG